MGMTFQQLLDWIKVKDQDLRRINTPEDKVKRRLNRMAKLGEEFGELSSQVLSQSSFQRDRNGRKFNLEELGGEVADVLITTMLLAESFDIDITNALEKKIAKIDKRFKNL